MLSQIFITACLAAGALAAGEPYDVQFISQNASLPKIMVYGPLSATLLSASNYSHMDNINYGSGIGPTIPELISNTSEVLRMAQIAYHNFPVSAGGSSSMNSSTFLNVTKLANEQLCAPGSDIVGLIMIHGTNTLEETAFGVDLTLNCSKPFIVTGAMRPDTYYSPDGRANFYQAVAAAVSPASRNRGGMIAMNDRLVSIYYATKFNANTPDTFKAIEQGNLGAFLAGQPYYYFDAAYPTGRPHFKVSNTTVLPSVIVLWGQQGFDASLMYAAVANGAKGIVIMGAGAGGFAAQASINAADLYKKGIPVVSATRPITGASVPEIKKGGPIIHAGYLGGEQARIVLQLAINANYSMDQIHDLFEKNLWNAVYGPWVNQIDYQINGAKNPGM